MQTEQSPTTPRYSHTTFEWDTNPYPQVPDTVKMVVHFETEPELREINVTMEVGERA